MVTKSNSISIQVGGGGGGTSTVQVSITQAAPGDNPVWHISGITPSGGFEVLESVSAPGQGPIFSDTFGYFADSSGDDSRAFGVDGGVTGDVVALKVIDRTNNNIGSASFTLL